MASVDVPSMEISFPWNYAIHTGSWDWPCTWHAVFIFHLCCNHCQCFWPFYGFVVFHCLCEPHFAHLLICCFPLSCSDWSWLGVLVGCALRNGPHGKSLTLEKPPAGSYLGSLGVTGALNSGQSDCLYPRAISSAYWLGL